MSKIFKCRKLFVIGIVLVIVISIVLIFSLEKNPYCNDPYRLYLLKDGSYMCMKTVTTSSIGYECEDNENYELMKDSWCVLRRDLMIEPTVSGECNKGDEVIYQYNDYTQENQQWCRSTKSGYSYVPRKVYTCPDGYVSRGVYYDSPNSFKEMCVLNKYSSRHDFEAGVSSIGKCPSGYEYDIVGYSAHRSSLSDARLCSNGKCDYSNSDTNTGLIVEEQEYGCVKDVKVKPSYKLEFK